MTGHRRAVGVRVATAVLLVWGATSCGSGGTEIIEVYGAPDSTRLELAVGACGATSTSVEVSETDEEVTLLVTTEGGEGPECADAVTVDLDAPLGDRRLVDSSTNDEVEVLPLEE